MKGTKQKVIHKVTFNSEQPESRSRSAAYPFEIPYRLINMYSIKADTVLDPFSGTGTTSLAALTAERNSIAVDIDPSFAVLSCQTLLNTDPAQLNHVVKNRLTQHKSFLELRNLRGDVTEMKHFNAYHNLPVITAQETALKLNYIDSVFEEGGVIRANYMEEAESPGFITRKNKVAEELVIPF